MNIMKKLFIASIILTSAFATTPVVFAKSNESTKNVQMNETTLQLTEQNFSHAETSRNFRNWVARGATTGLAKMRQLPPRGKAAPTVQMNDDTLYGIAIVKAVGGKVSFSIPKTDVYMAVQVITEAGHGQQYVVEPGKYNLEVETEYAFILYRSGTEKGIEASAKALDLIDERDLNIAIDYQVQNYDYEEVEEWVKSYTAEVNSRDSFTYTFPRRAALVTDLHQWNLENSAGWGGASPVAFVGNLYENSKRLKGDETYTTTFEDPESKFFTSVTVYDKDKYLIPGAHRVSSYTWEKNADGTITVTFNGGKDAKNNIDTQGQDFTFTSRYYGVHQNIIDGETQILENLKKM